jgi:uncharacterized membrane protein YjjP (DUF1212 family)
MMKKYSLSNSYNKALVVVTFAAIIYSILGLFTDNTFTGIYLGTVILSSIILFLALSILVLTKMAGKDVQNIH